MIPYKSINNSYDSVKFYPIYDMVFIEPVRSDTAGEIIIPDSAKPKPAIGRVLSIGPWVSGVEPGDKVIFNRFAGEEISVNGREGVLLSYIDVKAVIS